MVVAFVIVIKLLLRFENDDDDVHAVDYYSAHLLMKPLISPVISPMMSAWLSPGVREAAPGVAEGVPGVAEWAPGVAEWASALFGAEEIHLEIRNLP